MTAKWRSFRNIAPFTVFIKPYLLGFMDIMKYEKDPLLLTLSVCSIFFLASSPPRVCEVDLFLKVGS